MKVKVLYFAAVRDLVGSPEENIELPSDMNSIARLAEHLAHLHPELVGRLENVRFARNEEFAKSSDAIFDGDTIALIPPVAGG
ncbi:MAG: molybdopterin converting factor subunit 1 [Polyangiaceae bacterium]